MFGKMESLKRYSACHTSRKNEKNFIPVCFGSNYHICLEGNGVQNQETARGEEGRGGEGKGGGRELHLQHYNIAYRA